MTDRSQDAQEQTSKITPANEPVSSQMGETLPRQGDDTLSSAPTPTPKIPGFTILEEIGRGGMGVVYKAHHQRLDCLVALKVVLTGKHSSLEERQRMLREAKAIAALQHPSIIHVFEVGENDEHPYLALELCTRKTLADCIQENPLPPEEAAQIIRTLASAIHVAHQHDIIHRDLKPGNVLLTEDRSLKITDFGLAKKLDESEALTRTNTVMGTPSYAPPEQVHPESKPIDIRADIYSLGAVLYELLTGRPPFKAATTVDTILQVIREAPVPPRALNSKLPRDLETICLKCLEKDPQKRYSTAEELGRELERFLAGESIQARPVGQMARLWRWCRRHPVVATIVCFVFLTLSLGAIAATSFAIHSKRLVERANKEQSERIQAQVESLLISNPQSVETILQNLKPFCEEIRPRLIEVRAEPINAKGDSREEAARKQRRIRAALALLDEDPQQVDFLKEQMLSNGIAPREMLLIRDRLAEKWGKEIAKELWQRLKSPETRNRQQFPAMVALARFDSNNPLWKRYASPLAQALLETSSLSVGIWSQGLVDVKDHLLAPLLMTYQTSKNASYRRLATSLLLEHGGDRPELLSHMALDADPRQFELVFPKLKEHRASVIPVLEKELKRSPIVWDEALPDPEWQPLSKELQQEIEQAQGMVTDYWALCQNLALDRFAIALKEMRESGYRPVRCRPFAPASDQSARIAAIWTRDHRQWQSLQHLTFTELREQDRKLQAQGYAPVDVSGYGGLKNPREARFMAVWIKTEPQDQDCMIEINGRKLGSAKPGQRMHAVSYQSFFTSQNRLNYCRILCAEKGHNPGWSYRSRLTEQNYQALLNDHNFIPLDIALTPRSTAGTGKVDYAILFKTRPYSVKVLPRALTLNQHLAHCRQCYRNGFRPVAISVVDQAHPSRPGQTNLAAISIWQRPLPYSGTGEPLAKRKANAAATLIKLGKPLEAWKLLRQAPFPDARSHMVERLRALEVDLRSLVEQLKQEKDVSIRRGIVLALGGYETQNASKELQKELKELLVSLYRNHPDPGLHSAIQWLAQKHQSLPKQPPETDLAKAISEAAQSLRGKQPPKGQRWYHSRQGLTMALIPSPSKAQQPEGLEKLSRRIQNGYAISTTEVTVEEFLRYRQISYRRPFSPFPNCPINQISYYEAVAYCRWLSEQEGIPEKEMCYPALPVIAKAETARKPIPLPADYLNRTGYRLPTPAEWEFACRAGTLSTYPSGQSEKILLQHGVVIDNSKGRSQPVTALKPNALGLFGTVGNMWEFCQFYEYFPYTSSPSSNWAAIRGGTFLSTPAIAQPWQCVRLPMHERAIDIAFRVAGTWNPGAATE